MELSIHYLLLWVFFTQAGSKGRGLRAKEVFEKDEFIMEYVGEVINHNTFTQRMDRSQVQQFSSVLRSYMVTFSLTTPCMSLYNRKRGGRVTISWRYRTESTLMRDDMEICPALSTTAVTLTAGLRNGACSHTVDV